MITKCIGFLKKDQSWPSEKKRNLANHLCKNDIREKPAPSEVPCKGCKICKMMNPKQIVVNEKSKQVVTVKPGATCNTENVVYALNCKKCKQIYVGHTGDSMKIRYSKHKYDVNNRPTQNEFATHCHRGHDLEKDIEISILDYGIGSLEERERVEDRFICRLQTREPTGMNTRIGPYAKEMYHLWGKASGVTE